MLTTIQAGNPDVIANLYNTSFGQEAGQFSEIAYSLGMTNVVIGWSPYGNDEGVLPDYSNAAGPLAANGDVVAMEFRRTQDMPGWSTFLAAYQAANFANATTNPDIWGAYAYDAARIIIAAIGRANSTNSVAIRDQIAATKDYAGVVGTYQGFDSHGDVIPQWSWLEQFQNGQWVILNLSKVFLPVVIKWEDVERNCPSRRLTRS